jgi:hypothetical protein
MSSLEERVRRLELENQCLRGQHDFIYETTKYTKSNFTFVTVVIAKCQHCNASKLVSRTTE